MPVKNTIRQDADDLYYHVYNRTLRPKLFYDSEDYEYFVKLLKRYLLPKSEVKLSDHTNYLYPTYHGKLQLNAYCLMPTHYHLLVYQAEQGYLKKFMQSLFTSYVHYYNKKYHYKGTVFESNYKSKWIHDTNYLLHITRYIHMNPQQYLTYPYSTLTDYLVSPRNFVHTSHILELYKDQTEYKQFLQDYEQYQKDLITFRNILAD